MIEKGCTGTKTDSVFLGQYLPFIKLRSACFNAYYLLLTATYAVQTLVDVSCAFREE